MWKVVVCSIPSTLLVRLLPEVQKLLLQLANRTQIQDIITRDLVIQCRVIHMWQQPKHAQASLYVMNKYSIMLTEADTTTSNQGSLYSYIKMDNPTPYQNENRYCYPSTFRKMGRALGQLVSIIMHCIYICSGLFLGLNVCLQPCNDSQLLQNYHLQDQEFTLSHKWDIPTLNK